MSAENEFHEEGGQEERERGMAVPPRSKLGHSVGSAAMLKEGGGAFGVTRRRTRIPGQGEGGLE